MIRVVVADDQELVRVGLTGLLNKNDGIEVVAVADSGVGTLIAVRETKPDVVLMDVRMPGMDGLEATHRIMADPDLSGTRVIVLTTFDLDEYVFEALKVGASGFLTKDVDPADLRRAVRVVASGESLLSPRATTRVIAEFLRHREVPMDRPRLERLTSLTAREREVMTLVAKGLGNNEIGRQLSMSPATARTHVSRAMAKLGARDRVQLVVIAYESGLVTRGHD